MLARDASGSMWGKIDEQTKIEIARDVIDDMVSTWDKGAPLGLMATVRKAIAAILKS